MLLFVISNLKLSQFDPTTNKMIKYIRDATDQTCWLKLIDITAFITNQAITEKIFHCNNK
jgi:hypothetical protein